MSRKNRTVIPDAVYHVSSTTVAGLPLIADSTLKSRIVDVLFGVADFSGVEVLSWTILDDRLDVFLHVPSVPASLRTSSDNLHATSSIPASHVFSMRPPECTVPRWSDPDQPEEVTEGDSPRKNRPDTGFSLTDEQMLERLRRLYCGTDRADGVAKRWRRWRERGLDGQVEAEKERYCRRMYNPTQFVKSLKERVVRLYRENHVQTGHFWSDRFRSSIIEASPAVLQNVVAECDYRVVRRGCVHNPSDYRWSSLFQATHGGAFRDRCRCGYERIYSCGWGRAKGLMARIFKDARNKEQSEHQASSSSASRRSRISQALSRDVMVFVRCEFVGVSDAFIARVQSFVPAGFPGRSVRRDVLLCRSFIWMPPADLAA